MQHFSSVSATTTHITRYTYQQQSTFNAVKIDIQFNIYVHLHIII